MNKINSQYFFDFCNEKKIYYSDFLKIFYQEYDFNKGFSHKYFEKIRVINKGNLGEFTSNVESDIKQSLKTAYLNASVLSIFNKNILEVYYPYTHKANEDFLNIIDKKAIEGIEKQINLFLKKYKNYKFNFKIYKKDKSFCASTGSELNQSRYYLQIEFESDYYNYFKHLQINNTKNLYFPSFKKIDSINLKNNYILSPDFVSDLYLFAFENKINFSNFEVKTTFSEGFKNRLYDDDGSMYQNIEFKKFEPSDIFGNKLSGCYFYNFNKNDFEFNFPDLKIKNGTISVNDLNYENYIILDFPTNFEIENGNLFFKSNFNYYKNKKYEGTIVKTAKIQIDSILNGTFTINREITGFDNFSIEAPFLNLGYYELL